MVVIKELKKKGNGKPQRAEGMGKRGDRDVCVPAGFPCGMRFVTVVSNVNDSDRKMIAEVKNRDGLVNSDKWETPKWLYEKLDKEFSFDFDPCPIDPTFDGLTIEWGKSNFVNPPYNRIDKPKFIQKAFEEWKKGKTCVLLLPSATGTKQFHELILPHAEVRFLKGRVAFKGTNTKGELSEKNTGKHDSMIVIFRA